jgi:hypothetical protein
MDSDLIVLDKQSETESESDIDFKLQEKFNQFKNIMKIENKKRRKEQLALVTGLLFPDEIDFLFEFRREIRKNKSKVKLEVKLEEFYLFEWMQSQNIIQYCKFKEGLGNVLEEVATTCIYSDFQTKHLIGYVISRFLDDIYIK